MCRRTNRETVLSIRRSCRLPQAVDCLKLWATSCYSLPSAVGRLSRGSLSVCPVCHSMIECVKRPPIGWPSMTNCEQTSLGFWSLLCPSLFGFWQYGFRMFITVDARTFLYTRNVSCLGCAIIILRGTVKTPCADMLTYACFCSSGSHEYCICLFGPHFFLLLWGGTGWGNNVSTCASDSVQSGPKVQRWPSGT